MTAVEPLTLASFLLARIAEDEAVARGREGTAFHRWRFVEYGDKRGGYVSGVADDWHGNAYVEVAEHIARHDPARVLAECEAKRRIVDLYESWKRQADSADPEFRPILGTQAITGHTALRVLASVYADHPDYREEWRT